MAEQPLKPIIRERITKLDSDNAGDGKESGRLSLNR